MGDDTQTEWKLENPRSILLLADVRVCARNRIASRRDREPRVARRDRSVLSNTKSVSCSRPRENYGTLVFLSGEIFAGGLTDWIVTFVRNLPGHRFRYTHSASRDKSRSQLVICLPQFCATGSSAAQTLSAMCAESTCP